MVAQPRKWYEVAEKVVDSVEEAISHINKYKLIYLN